MGRERRRPRACLPALAALLLFLVGCSLASCHVALAFQFSHPRPIHSIRARWPQHQPPSARVPWIEEGSGSGSRVASCGSTGRHQQLLIRPAAAAATAAAEAAVLVPPPPQDKGTELQIEIRAADRSDTRALVDFVLKCEGEWATAGHAKKEALAAKLDYHLSNGVTIYMAFHTGAEAPSPFVPSDGQRSSEGHLIGIYASTAIDHMTVPRLPNTEAFPSLSQACPRRFLSDVKVADGYKRRGIASRMLQHFEEAELRDAEFCGAAADGVLACLFVARDNVAGKALYDKCGYAPVDRGVDWTKKRFSALLEAGAIGVEEAGSVSFMAKYIPPGGWDGWGR